MNLVAARKPALHYQDSIRRGVDRPTTATGWSLPTFCGRLVELSAGHASAVLSLTMRLIREAQLQGETVAWVARPGSSFFPPDAVRCGVDLGALPVIRPRQTMDALSAADHLLRSGAFGLVAIDLQPRAFLPMRAQTRLASLAKKHLSALLLLTEKEQTQASLGSLISLRAHIERHADSSGRRYRCRAQVLKDKQNGPGWQHLETLSGPPGLS